jgi:hypothetical protein
MKEILGILSLSICLGLIAPSLAFSTTPSGNQAKKSPAHTKPKKNQDKKQAQDANASDKDTENEGSGNFGDYEDSSNQDTDTGPEDGNED